MKTFALATLGCKVNRYDGESIRRQLHEYDQVEFGEPADLYIINTCGVTAEADSKARQLIRRAKRAAPNTHLILTGCFRPAEEAALRDIGVDQFLGNSEKDGLAAALGAQALETSPSEPLVKAGRGRTRVFLKIQDGCDQRCSYCAIPNFRGLPVSRPLAEVVEEIAALADDGIPEVVLTGIHIGKYGIDLDQSVSLAGLAREIIRSTTLPRLRISSLEPPEVTKELVELMASEDRIGSHLHLPLQSGSNRILLKMNRPYRSHNFLQMLRVVREMVPQISISTDIMVGFPGESVNDFAATMNVVEEAAFSGIHVFKYSPRPETPAADFPDQVPPRIKSERALAVRGAGQKSATRYAARFTGSIVSVLTEQPKDGVQTGLTGEYLRVKFDETVGPAGRIVPARVEKTEGEFLKGRLHDE